MTAETITQEPQEKASKPARKRAAEKTEEASPKATRPRDPAQESKKGAARGKTPSAKAAAAAARGRGAPGVERSQLQAMAMPREVAGLFVLAAALGTLLAMVSFHPADMSPVTPQVQNLIGPAGAFVADVLLAILGLGAFCLNALLWYLGALLLLGRRPELRPTEYTGQALFVLAGTILAHLTLGKTMFFGHSAGGLIGEFLAELLRATVGTVGAYLCGVVMATLSLMFVAKLSLSTVARFIAAQLHKVWAYLRHQVAVYMAYRARYAQERARQLAEAEPDAEEIARHEAMLAMRPIGQAQYAFEEGFEDQVQMKLARRLGRALPALGAEQTARAPQGAQPSHSQPMMAPAPPQASPQASPQSSPQASPQSSSQASPQASPQGALASGAAGAAALAPRAAEHALDELARELKRVKKRGAQAEPASSLGVATGSPEGQEGWSLGELRALGEAGPDEVGRAEFPEDFLKPDSPYDPDEVEDARGDTVQVADDDVLDMSYEQHPDGFLGDEHGDFGPRIIDARSAQERRIRELLTREDGEGVLFKPQAKGSFELPSVSFLNYEDSANEGVDIDTLRAMAAQIEQTLRDFKVEGAIKDICPGPVITVFEFSPAPGVKISRIANLSDDLAMALSALSVRIVAPIPGKGVVGIEVPNPKREMVFMKEIIADDTFLKSTKMALPMGLGKDTAGNPIVTDLAKMPHLLVAGSTGSGKSVAVNTMITSLLYKNSPDDVRMIMVDPKMLEFSIYADIPHLLLPVVTDPKQATVALNWAVQEMERRYQALAELSVRNIAGYNVKVEQLMQQAQHDMEQGVEGSAAIKSLGIDAEGDPEHKRLPYIVVIIDEFADLMMTASKDVETAVARLAQKARAAGIHLILATQRPSTDVITGLIKANFPTRIALRVTSKTDSRVILDHNGAENLLGNGDMLFVPPGTSHMQRVHGAYVSEKEIEKIVEFLKQQGKPQYDESILQEEPGEEEDNGIDESEKDEFYRDAVRLVIESKQASISMIQRKLRVGYNRAARMVEMMEIEGIVSPADSCKPRQVILDISPY